MPNKQDLPRETVEDILNQFDLGQIEKIEPLTTSGNISYVIGTDRKKYFLRLCLENGPRWRSNEEIAAEIELIDYLHAARFPVFVPIKNKNGEEAIHFGKHNGYLREFIEAEEKLTPSFEEITKFGETIGWLHSLTENYKTRNHRAHIFDLTETKRHFLESKDMILTSNFKDKNKFVEKFEKEISSLNFPDNLPQGTIHEDLGKRHVLWQKDEVVGIVDFDRSYFGKLVLDLGQACRGWCFVDDWQKWSDENFQALLQGYEKKRKLTELEKKYLFDAIKFGIIERSLSYCLRFIGVTHNKEDEEFALDSIFRQIGLVPEK